MLTIMTHAHARQKTVEKTVVRRSEFYKTQRHLPVSQKNTALISPLRACALAKCRGALDRTQHRREDHRSRRAPTRPRKACVLSPSACHPLWCPHFSPAAFRHAPPPRSTRLLRPFFREIAREHSLHTLPYTARYPLRARRTALVLPHGSRAPMRLSTSDATARVNKADVHAARRFHAVAPLAGQVLDVGHGCARFGRCAPSRNGFAVRDCSGEQHDVADADTGQMRALDV